MLVLYCIEKKVCYKGKTFLDDIQALGWLCEVFTILFILAITVYQRH